MRGTCRKKNDDGEGGMGDGILGRGEGPSFCDLCVL